MTPLANDRAVVQRKPFAGGHREFIDALLAGTIHAERLVGTPGVLEYDDPEEPDVVAVGGIYQTMSAVNPGAAVVAGGLGYGIWLRIAEGRVLVGTATTSGVESGAATATPAGSVSAPTFTGGVASTSLVSAGTPTGTCSAPTFVGAPLTAHSHSPGTLATSAHSGAAVADHPSHTHGYTQVPNHVHVQRAQGGTTASTTGTHLMTSAATGGALRSSAASTLDPTGGVGVASTQGTTLTHSVTQPAAHTVSGVTSADSAGTPAGSCSAPTFVGTALGTHQHSLTPTGTCSAPVFVGSPLPLQPLSLSCFTWVRTG